MSYDSPSWQAVEVPDDSDDPNGFERKACDDTECGGHIVTDGSEYACETCSLMHGANEARRGRERDVTPGVRRWETPFHERGYERYDHSDRVILAGGHFHAYLSDDDGNADSYEYCIDDFESMLAVA